MIFITSICSCLLGYFLQHMGYGPYTWQFWAIGIVYLVPNTLWMYKDYKHSKENK